MDELKPCPFCGSKRLRLHVIDICEFAFKCMKCNAVGSPALDEVAAIAKWNMRHDPEADDGR